MTDDLRAAYARLCERFETRLELYDQAVKRHKRELDLVYRDLAEAGAARDRFAREHPDVLAPPVGEEV